MPYAIMNHFVVDSVLGWWVNFKNRNSSNVKHEYSLFYQSEVPWIFNAFQKFALKQHLLWYVIVENKQHL